MEMLSMLKVGYTILRSETPATDLVNTFMDWAARRSLVLLAIFLPPYYIYKLTTSAFAAAVPEDVAGKVVLITGASSGIGEQIAYQYAKKGARLALVARRVGSLHDVAERAKDVGSPNVLVVAGDVANPEDCQRFVQATVDHFGRLDHLVNNAGVANVCWFEEVSDVADLKQVLAVNFWGAVHPTHCALPLLKKSGGKIFVNSSAAAVLAMPRMSFYNARKAAVLNFFETLRMELGDEVGITIATPGWIESEMTKGKHLSKGRDGGGRSRHEGCSGGRVPGGARRTVRRGHRGRHLPRAAPPHRPAVVPGAVPVADARARGDGLEPDTVLPPDRWRPR